MKKILLTIIAFSTILFQTNFAFAGEFSGEPLPDASSFNSSEQATDSYDASSNSNDPAFSNTPPPTLAPPTPTGEDILDLPDTNGIIIDAQFKPINAPDAINRKYNKDSLNAFLQFLGGTFIEITGAISVVMLVIAGFMFSTARGDESQVDSAKSIIKFTILGMVVIITSFTMVKAVISLIFATDTY